MGHSADVPSFCPRRIAAALAQRVAGGAVDWTEALGEPRFPGFRGRVERAGGGWRCFGKLQRSAGNAAAVRVTEIPFPTSYNAYDTFLKGLAEKELLTGLRSAVEADPPYFEFTLQGKLADPKADLFKELKLSEYVPWKFKLWEGARLVVYDGLDDFCERWYARKVAAVARRQAAELERRDAEIAEKALRLRFVRAVLDKRIVVPAPDMIERTVAELGVEPAKAKELLGRSLLSLSPEAVEKERAELAEARRARDEYAALSPEQIYAAELDELRGALPAADAAARPAPGGDAGPAPKRARAE